MAAFPLTVSYPSFIAVRYTTSAAIAQNGTFTLPYPAGTNVGSFSGARASAAFIEGLAVQAYSAETIAPNNSGLLGNIPPLFTLAYGASITFTWLGATPIPANTSIQLQLQLIGVDRPGPYDTQAFDAAPAKSMYVRFGAPATAVTTAILATTAVADALLHTLATPYQMDVPRNITYVSSGADAETMTVRGLDRYGVNMTETVTLNGATPVVGKKAFFVVQSYQAGSAMTNNLSLGFGVVLGIPVILERKNFVFREFMDDAVLTTGTFVAADITVPSATTGDIRGTYSPATAPNGAHIYELLAANPDQLAQLPQF
jgi:hypothetical protein